MERLEILPGQKFHKLVVIYESEPKREGKRFKRRMYCECECGNKGDYMLSALTSGNTKSCGCHRIEVNVTKNKASAGFKKNGYRKLDEEYWERRIHERGK